MGDEIPKIPSFTSLPNELILLILHDIECRDILQFGETCKQFNEIVKSDQYLWKLKFKSIVSEDIFNLAELHCDDGNWYDKVKDLHIMKKTIYAELATMSPKYYWDTADIDIHDLTKFLNLALSHNMSYYHTVKILQDLIAKGNKYLDAHVGVKPFTLTEMYYAKDTVSHLLHLYLCVEWVQKLAKDELYPDIVVNFFIRWTEVERLHDDNEVARAIEELVNKVENTLSIKQTANTTGNDSIKEKCSRKEISEREILSAITDVIYNQENMVLVNSASIYSLDPVQVIANRCGNAVAVAAIYQSVARKLSVPCEVVAFPNHLFLQWRDMRNGRLYRINLNTGELQPKRTCPYSQDPSNEYKYAPDLLLQYLVTTFTETMERRENRHTRNSSTLLSYMQTEYPMYRPFQNVHLILRQEAPLHLMPSINIKYISDEHKQLVYMLSKLSMKGQHRKQIGHIFKKRNSNVIFAVGMICSHKESGYVCVINGWEPTCYRHWHQGPALSELQFGGRQPFYDAYASDQSKRYIAQEHLVEVTHPRRMKDLEDVLGREFTHFNGFSYEPNDEKRAEYPEDDAVRTMFHSRASKNKNLDGPSYNVN